ncbi:MAG: hypothetical protein M1814_001842 [Vezdaea aestivalis]|nr:MAG: hypothetical protein M1814_001842 [Vezdaea aestivalis]
MPNNEDFQNSESHVQHILLLSGIDHFLSQASHLSFLLSNRYLEEDPSTTVLERRHTLEGYEVYIVEQWAYSRDQPTFVITTFTGDPKHSAIVGVLGVPTDEKAWSPRLSFYMKAVSQFQARKKQTPVGLIMITNLNGFSSGLNVIPVADGDLRKHREDFIVNADLKRMGCSGRAGLTLAPPANATQAKFCTSFKTSDHIPFYRSVIEMIKLCQIALTLFGVLAQEYADGLLCDVTESAIGNWWAEIGTEQYNIEAGDGILGPTTVAALLGLLMGARSRLSAYGAPVGKDPFDIENMKRGIAYFQKYQKISRTRRLDRVTLNRLHRVTAKAATEEGWRVQKAVKSTVAELKGKGGELAIDTAGHRENSTIAAVETTDIEQFAQLVKGDRAKWLWRGRLRKNVQVAPIEEADDPAYVFGHDESGGYVWSAGPPILPKAASDPPNPSAPLHTIGISGQQESMMERDLHSKRTVLRSVTGRMSDARTGLGRIKDAVGIPSFRTHHSKPSRDEFSTSDPELFMRTNESTLNTSQDDRQTTTTQEQTDELGSQMAPSSKLLAPFSSSDKFPRVALDDASPKLSPSSSEESLVSPLFRKMSERQQLGGGLDSQNDDVLRPPSFTDISVDGSAENERFTLQSSAIPDTPFDNINPLLRRSLSTSAISGRKAQPPSEARWPRHLSFSIAEEAVLDWEPVQWVATDLLDEGKSPSDALRVFDSIAVQARHIRKRLADVEHEVRSWVEGGLLGVESINASLGKDQESLATLYYQRLEDYENLQSGSAELLTEERNQLSDAIQEIEDLNAKLKYELDSLATKVDDVEDGVVEFEKQVEGVEATSLELEPKKRPESWTRWAVRLLTGVGPLANET